MPPGKLFYIHYHPWLQVRDYLEALLLCDASLSPQLDTQCFRLLPGYAACGSKNFMLILPKVILVLDLRIRRHYSLPQVLARFQCLLPHVPCVAFWMWTFRSHSKLPAPTFFISTNLQPLRRRPLCHFVPQCKHFANAFPGSATMT